MPAVMAGVSLMFTAILAFGGGYMVGDMRNASGTLKAEKAALQTRIDELEQHVGELKGQLAAAKASQPATTGKKDAAESVGDLTFYSELPRQKVMPAPLGDTGPPAVQRQHGGNVEAYANLPPPQKEVAGVAVKPDAAANTASPDTVYKLQAGSFVRRSDAEVLLNRMIRAGIRATVSQAQVPNVGTRYRVFTAPVSGMAEAEGMKSLLRDELGIDGLLMRE